MSQTFKKQERFIGFLHLYKLLNIYLSRSLTGPKTPQCSFIVQTKKHSLRKYQNHCRKCFRAGMRNYFDGEVLLFFYSFGRIGQRSD